jgi:capsid portal protein
MKEYMNDIKGKNGQHAFMVLEVENTENQISFEGEKPPEIQVVPLASILQKDELFQEYLDNNRRRVQSSFLLPDLYVGYTTDFNRATAQTAMEVTEEQVFQPERVSLAWVVNNKLLNEYRFQYVEAYFKAPNITNPDDLSRILNITERAGGLTPNKAKEITYSIMGETSEDYPEEWGNIPIALLKGQAASVSVGAPPSASTVIDATTITQLENQIQKAAAHDDAIVAVMKEVRVLLEGIRAEAVV